MHAVWDVKSANKMANAQAFSNVADVACCSCVFRRCIAGPDAAWRGRISRSCKHELTSASLLERYIGEGSTSHPARQAKVDGLPRVPILYSDARPIFPSEAHRLETQWGVRVREPFVRVFHVGVFVL